MTFIGKLFVMVNLALSLILATAAFATYSSGIDWSNNKGDKDRPPGKLVAVKNEIDELTKQLQLTDESWKAVRAELRTREDQRRGDRVFYAQQLRALYVGKDAVKIVGPELTGRPNLIDPPDAPLQTFSFYTARVQELRDENGRLAKDLEAKIKEDTDLTNQLTGDPDKKTKGLRRLLVEERDKAMGIVSEEGITDGMRINALVEEQLVMKRLETIRDSIGQLQKYLKVKHGVDVPLK